MADDTNLINQINQEASAPAPAAPAGQTAGQAAGQDLGGWLGNMNSAAAGNQNAAQGLLSSAQSGALKFDPATGQSLLNTLNNHIDDLNNLEANSNFASFTNFQLGQTPGGKAVAPFNTQVVSTGDQSFTNAHKLFKQSLATAAQAVQIAMDNYAKTDSDNAQKLKPKD